MAAPIPMPRDRLYALSTGSLYRRRESPRRSIFEYREYVVPGDFVLVSAAVRFTRLATDCLSARAVASAAWAVLSVAEREPNDLEGTDQLLHQRARSSRCVTLVSLAVKDRGAGHG